MKNFVFDLYGTIVDIKTDETSGKFKAALSRYFKKLGVENFWTLYNSLCKNADRGGENEFDLLAVFKEILGSDGERAFAAAQYFRKKSRSRLKVYRGARGLLKNLNKRGANVYLLSNAQSCFTLPELEKLKLTRYFDGILISSDSGKRKPSPEFFGAVIQKYSLDRGQTVYIGNDYKADILGAKAAGLSAAYIKSNLSPDSDDLRTAKNNADFATDEFKRLSDYLLSLV